MLASSKCCTFCIVVFCGICVHSTGAWVSFPRPTTALLRRGTVCDVKSATAYEAASPHRAATNLSILHRVWSESLASAVVCGMLIFGAANPARASVSQEAFFSPPRVDSMSMLQQKEELETSFISSRISSLLLSEQSNKEADLALLDEVWSLVNKYYIDRGMGEGWNKMYHKYKTLVQKASSDDARFKLVSEMVATLGDKYSRMLDPQQYAYIQKYDLIGVGVTLMPDANKNIIVGAPPIAGSEADRVGLKTGDIVTAINGVSTNGRTAFDIIDQISENPNAKSVTMTVKKGNNDKPSDLTMERMFQEVKNPIKYKISETRADGTVVGFVKILEFNSLVKGSLEQALSELEAAGANAYVIDIRQNTGGAFQSAVEISGLFEEDRIATYVVDNTKVKIPFRTPKGKLAIDKTDPIVVWIDQRSASASEVLAASLHDNCRAVLMGEKSFGKGLIQAVYGLKNGAGLVLTVARYATPSGSDIQGVGITPDIGTEAMPFGPFGLGTDTSKIDFNDIRNRLSEKQCRIPEPLR